MSKGAWARGTRIVPLAPLPEPDPFADSFTALVSARALTSATMLGVFEALHEAPASAGGLAERLGLDELGADTLLTTLSTLGYVEADDLAAAQAAMARTEVNTRWQSEMAQFFAGIDGRPPDEGFLLLTEVFHLEDQLSLDRLDRPTTDTREVT